MTEKPLKCYRVELPTTNGLRNTYQNKNGKYIEVQCGIIHVLTYSLLEVGESFPDALSVEELGPGFLCGFDEGE